MDCAKSRTERNTSTSRQLKIRKSTNSIPAFLVYHARQDRNDVRCRFKATVYSKDVHDTRVSIRMDLCHFDKSVQDLFWMVVRT